MYMEHFPFASTEVDINYKVLACGNQSFKVVDSNNSDLNTTKIEVDLAKYIFENKEILPVEKDSTVLVLGCPCFGLPGVVALQQGYKNTTFVAQDAQRVQDIIWPSVFLNCVEQMSLTRCFSVPAKEERGWLSLAADSVADASG